MLTDSDVMPMDRSRVDFVHVRNQLQIIDAADTKIGDLVAQLSNFQLESKLYTVPFETLQRQIIMWVPSGYRMIVYRRFMMKICSRIAIKEIVTNNILRKKRKIFVTI